MVLTKELFDDIYSKVPRICVEILIKTDKGFILSKRLIPPCVGMWHIPGGTVYLGEKLDEAARRVGKEELGVEINPLEIIGVVNYLDIYKGIGQAVGIVFLCDLDSFHMLYGSYQAEEIDMFRINNIPENTISAHKKLLQSIAKIGLVYLEE